jgi:BASS family bile acid:Na+ symporter
MDSLTLSLIQTGSLAGTVAFMFSRGLETRKEDLWYLGARPGLLLKSVLTVDVLVPLIAIAVIIFARPSKATAVGMLLLAASPVAPMALQSILKAGGDREYALGLHLVLAWLAIVTTPITLELLSGVAGLRLEVGPEAVAGIVGQSILLPINAGVIAGMLFPSAARQMIRPLELFSGVISTLVTIILLLSTYQLLFTLDIGSYLAIALMIAGALAAGHLISGRRPGEQATLALESATGNVGLALLIASTFTTLENALPVIIPYIAISAIICAIYARLLTRESRSATPGRTV